MRSNERTYQEWSRYEWASEDVPTNEHDALRWNLAAWVGQTADGRRVPAVDPAALPEGDTAFTGRRHNPGGGSRWAQGYRH